MWRMNTVLSDYPWLTLYTPVVKLIFIFAVGMQKSSEINEVILNVDSDLHWTLNKLFS